MAAYVLQNGGFLFGLIGAVSLIAATALNKWSIRDRQGDVLAGVYIHNGLWEGCETTSSGFTECHPNYGILGFSGRTRRSHAFVCKAPPVTDSLHSYFDCLSVSRSLSHFFLNEEVRIC